MLRFFLECSVKHRIYKSGTIFKFVESDDNYLVQKNKYLANYDKKKIWGVKFEKLKSFIVIFVNFPKTNATPTYKNILFVC